MASAAELELRANKKLRSFALFPAKKRAKYESAYGLFGEAVRAHLDAKTYVSAANCLRQQARLCINKLQRPVEAAMHYMEATRAYMMCEELAEAFECVQLAVSARTKPSMKHKDATEALAVAGITVTAQTGQGFPSTLSPDSPATSAMVASAAAGGGGIGGAGVDGPAHSGMLRPSNSPQHPALTRLGNLAVSTRSPALTSQAGTISMDGKSLILSSETLQAPISSSARTIQIQPHPGQGQGGASGASSGGSSSLFGPASVFAAAGAASSSASSASASSASSSAARPAATAEFNNASAPPKRQRRHSLSGSANSANLTADGESHAVLHLDLLLARLAVQLATDLWTDLDFRDAIVALEIASSLFATLLIAERNNIGGTFRKAKGTHFVPAGAAIAAAAASGAQAPAALVAGKSSSSSGHSPATGAAAVPILTADPPLIRSESASTPASPVKGAQLTVPDTNSLAIEERLAGLLGPNAHNPMASSMTVGSVASMSSRPITSKPIPTLMSRRTSTGFPGMGSSMVLDAAALILHAGDPHAEVGEGEGVFHAASTVHEDATTSILEESLVCRFQLANYYVTFDEELGGQESDVARLGALNQELRRAKALFEQVASQKPDEALVHNVLIPILYERLQEASSYYGAGGGPLGDVDQHVDLSATLVAQYAADDDKLHGCLFLAGLCDALIGIRTYMASQAPDPQPSSVKGAKPVPPPPSNRTGINKPQVPDLYLQTRTVQCPPILLRYREMSASFGNSAEIRLLRAMSGLLQLAANLTERLNDAFGTGATPHVAKQLFQAAWGAEIIREYTAIVEVYTRQKPLSSIVAKLLFEIKKAMKLTISGPAPVTPAAAAGRK